MSLHLRRQPSRLRSLRLRRQLNRLRIQRETDKIAQGHQIAYPYAEV